MVKPLKRFIQAVLSLALVGIACPSLGSSEGVHLLFELTGDVQLKKAGRSKFQEANFGDLLSLSDELKLSTKASATVYCSNQNEWKVPSGKVSVVSEGCPPGESTLKLPNGSRQPTRPGGLIEEALSAIPYIISPRNTSLLNDRPILRWNAVSGATSYIVQVQGSGVDWQQKTVATEIEYPGEPPLEKGLRYRVTVVADNGASSRSERRVGFTVLDDQKADSVLAAVEKLKQQGLTKEAEGLALAHLYRGNNLQAEAIELLEGLVKGGSQTVAVYRLLGDIYQQGGLSRLAKERYLKALELADAGDVEGQAAIQAGLGEADYALGNEDEAVQWLEKATAGYEGLGDKSQVQELEQGRDFFLGRE